MTNTRIYTSRHFDDSAKQQLINLTHQAMVSEQDKKKFAGSLILRFS